MTAAVALGATPEQRARDIVSACTASFLEQRTNRTDACTFMFCKQVSKMTLDEKVSFAWGKVGDYVGMVPASGPVTSLGIP